jgi:hypothetical protein
MFRMPSMVTGSALVPQRENQSEPGRPAIGFIHSLAAVIFRGTIITETPLFRNRCPIGCGYCKTEKEKNTPSAQRQRRIDEE